MLSPLEEILFWTGIMSNHGEFMLSSFSYNEKEPIQYARYYRDAFSALNERAKRIDGTDATAVNRLVTECFDLLCSLISFKRAMLAGMLECRLDSSLPPTFYNHMINEALEFCKVLAVIRSGAMVSKVCENLSLHRIWLVDAAGHAAVIADRLDPSECLLIGEAREFEKGFNCLSLKAEELYKMLTRTCLSDGALTLLNDEVKRKMTEFVGYLQRVKTLRARCMAMGALKPLVPDHMLREEYYYLDKIAEFGQG